MDLSRLLKRYFRLFCTLVFCFVFLFLFSFYHLVEWPGYRDSNPGRQFRKLSWYPLHHTLIEDQTSEGTRIRTEVKRFVTTYAIHYTIPPLVWLLNDLEPLKHTHLEKRYLFAIIATLLRNCSEHIRSSSTAMSTQPSEIFWLHGITISPLQHSRGSHCVKRFRCFLSFLVLKMLSCHILSFQIRPLNVI